MVQARGIIHTIVILYLAYWCVADDCTDKCIPPCTADSCHILSPALGGCWFEGSACLSCVDSKLDSCEQYPEASCEVNPCGLYGGCKWVMGSCIDANRKLENCRTDGCEHSYKCMADGECVHSSVSVQDYCGTAYDAHGFSYDVRAQGSCEEVAKVCNELERRCESMPGATNLDKKRYDECKILKNMCLQCSGDCELRKSVVGIEDIIYGIAAGIATVLIAINGLAFLTSDDPLTRNNAKRSIAYTVISLLILLVAIKFVEYLWIIFA